MEELGVERGDRTPQPGPGSRPEDEAKASNGEGELQVVSTNSEVGVSEGFEQPDWTALRFYEPGDRQVQEKHRHGQEDRRNDTRRHGQLVELVLEEGMGRMILAPIGADASIPVEHLVDPVDEPPVPRRRVTAASLRR